jgi:toxin ParE1/3/4
VQYDVSITPGAERDLEEIAEYIADHDSSLKADQVLERCLQVIEGLKTLPGRGSIPREPLSLGMRDFRQVFFKPYRVIYRIAGRKVFILLIADGCRDLQALLARRLLRD